MLGEATMQTPLCQRRRGGFTRISLQCGDAALATDVSPQAPASVKQSIVGLRDSLVNLTEAARS